MDQFSQESTPSGTPEKKETCGQVFVRSEVVRRLVRLRAKGQCEWCGQPGFQTSDGSFYIETHHIVPLSEGGPDSVSNVVAICPNHHREAHHGKTKDKMRLSLIRRFAVL